MNKKGFTLIELLAVIVILSVITLITVPMILNVIEESRKSSFQVTCNEIYDAYEQYEVQEELQGSKKENVIFEFGSKRTEREEIEEITYEPISKLKLKGELPTMGTYKIIKDTRELVVSNNKYTCIRDSKRNEVLNGSIADNDITNPILKGISLSSTTNSIQVVVEAEEPDGMIVKYYYKINGKETISESNNQVYTGLEKNKEYEIEVTVENKSGLRSETIKKTIQTKKMNNPEIKQINETPEEYEYATSRVIGINYDTQEGLKYYLKSSEEVEVIGNTIIRECGTETIPGNCIESNVTTIEANTWYETSSKTPSVIYKTNGTLYALTSDGTNTTGTSTYTITKIDTENPNVRVSVSGKTATFTFSDNVGILAYGVNQSNTTEPSYTSTTSTSISWTASSAGTYYVWVQDKAGNKANKSFEIDHSAFSTNITYKVDGNTYTELIQNGASSLSPKSFTPSKSGYTFVGWREDATATSSVLTTKIANGSPFTLYAVFRRTLNLYTRSNGSTATNSGYQYSNNGNISNPTIKVSNPSRSGWTFKGWSSSSSSTGIANSSLSGGLTITGDTYRYAVWTTSFTTSGKFTLTNGVASPTEWTQYGYSTPLCVINPDWNNFNSYTYSLSGNINKYDKSYDSVININVIFNRDYVVGSKAIIINTDTPMASWNTFYVTVTVTKIKAKWSVTYTKLYDGRPTVTYTGSYDYGNTITNFYPGSYLAAAYGDGYLSCTVTGNGKTVVY